MTLNVAYINFHNPAKSADDSELTDDDVIIRYDGNEEIIWLTILHASSGNKGVMLTVCLKMMRPPSYNLEQSGQNPSR